MKEFRWQAKTLAGQTRVGVYSASSPEEVIAYLRSHRLIPVAVKPRPRRFSLSGRSGRIRTRVVVSFTRQLASMITAGVPLLRSLQVLESQEDREGLGQVIGDVKQEVEAGSTLARALAKYPGVFPQTYVQTVRAGEMGGVLDDVLIRLADFLEKRAEIAKKVRGALLYPGVVFCVALLVTVFFMLVIIPVFEQTFQDLGVPLPLPTRLVILLSAFLSEKASVLLLFFSVGVPGAVAYYQTARGRRAVDGGLLRLPLFGPLLVKTILARMIQTLATLLRAGVPILEAVEVSARTSGNRVLEEALLRAKASIAAGSSLSDPLSRVGLIPPMVAQMVRVGEETGRLDEVLTRVAEFYGDDVDTAVESLSSILEPILILFVAVLIGALIVSLYLPIFEVAQAFG